VLRLKPDGTRSLLWQTDIANAQGHIVQETFGNGTIGQRLYQAQTGDLAVLVTGSGGANIRNLQDTAYSFDAVGNLKTRDDAIANLSETFNYDELNRVISTAATPFGLPSITKSYQYNAIGNITYKSDVGSYTYNPSGASSVRPHAVTRVAGALNHDYTYDANGNLLTGAGRTLTYTSFNKPLTINANGQTTTFQYDPNYNRLQKFTASQATLYLGKLYERVTTGTLVEHKHYVYGGKSLVAVYTERNNSINDTKYFHTDHLDSVQVITDENANVVERLSFDPHGKRRQASGQDASGTITSAVNRGFTRHEHDDEVGLINMNARLYDPVIGRFITADIVVDGPHGQGLNRYSYVLNNPLSRVDPTGHKSWRKMFRAVVAVAAIAYGYVGGFQLLAGSVAAATGVPVAVAGGAMGGGIVGFVAGGTAKSTLFGAFSGAVFGGVGNALGANAPLGLKAAAHGFAGGSLSYLGGGKFGDGYLGGAFGALAGGVPGLDNTVGRSLIGGIAAEIGGGKFRNGALTAAYAYLFNDLQHQKQQTQHPDADGRLTFSEATDWWRNGNGQPLTVDLNKIDLSGIRASDFSRGIGSSEVFNLLSPSHFGSLSDGLVYGNVTLTLGANNTVFATRGYDYYNFDTKSWSFSTAGRNVEAWLGSVYAGSGTPYYINLRGTATVQP
jgi:RHS repeat-associated protein